MVCMHTIPLVVYQAHQDCGVLPHQCSMHTISVLFTLSYEYNVL